MTRPRPPRLLTPRLAFCWLALGLAFPARGPAAIHYQAPLDQAHWQLESSNGVCQLAHYIPRYGRVVVEGRPDGGQRLYLDARLPWQGSRAGVLIAAAPFWNPDRAELTLGPVQLSDGFRPVELDALMTQRVLDTLADGLVPTLSSPLDEVGMSSRISVLPVAFSKAYASYRQCLSQLPPPPAPKPQVQQAKRAGQPASTAATRMVPGVRAAFSFSAHQGRLTPAQRAELDRIVAELQADPALTAAVHGYGNDSQRRLLNLELSRRRADAVRDYLVAAGVAIARIETTYHGGRHAAKGRRVELRLHSRTL